MALYIISYDIAEDDAFEYDPLWAALKALGATRILYSEWLVQGEVNQAVNVYNRLAQHTQSKDRLLVQEVANNAAWDKLLIRDDQFRLLLQGARG